MHFYKHDKDLFFSFKKAISRVAQKNNKLKMKTIFIFNPNLNRKSD